MMNDCKKNVLSTRDYRYENSRFADYKSCQFPKLEQLPGTIPRSGTSISADGHTRSIKKTLNILSTSHQLS